MRMPSWGCNNPTMSWTTERGGVELAALLAGVVSELVDQVLIRIAQHVARAVAVRLEIRVAEIQVIEMVEQAAYDPIAVGGTAQLGLVVPVGAGEHAVDAAGVGVLDLMAGDVERLAQVHGRLDDPAPVGGVRLGKLVLVGIVHRDRLGHAGGDCDLHLLIEPVGQPFQERHREDVVLVIGRVDLAAQDVGGLPKLRLQFLAGEWHGVPSVAALMVP